MRIRLQLVRQHRHGRFHDCAGKPRDEAQLPVSGSVAGDGSSCELPALVRAQLAPIVGWSACVDVFMRIDGATGGEWKGECEIELLALADSGAVRSCSPR